MTKQWKKLFLITLGGITFTAFLWLLYIWMQMPETIHVKVGKEQQMEFYVPVTATISKTNFTDNSYVNQAFQVKLNGPVTFYGECENTYEMQVKLFGVIPFKTMSIAVIENSKLIPLGEPVGVYVKTKGVMVLDTGTFMGMDGQEKDPAKSLLKAGDYIQCVNGKELENKKEFMECIEHCDGNPIQLEIKRGTEKKTIWLQPVLDNKEQYKAGLWVRDNAQGVGTLTYLDQFGTFGALGHGINDMDTGKLLEIEGGSLFHVDIVSILKGEAGNPGELSGIITYTKSSKMGDVFWNKESGIYGELKSWPTREPALDIGLKQEVHKGKAQILTTVSEKAEYYDVEILNTHLRNDNINRGIELQVTDPRLLEQTGGIIQGMSGSPILQDGKVIGAVTHVLVNDPTKGYGIFIENMLEKE